MRRLAQKVHHHFKKNCAETYTSITKDNSPVGDDFSPRFELPKLVVADASAPRSFRPGGFNTPSRALAHNTKANMTNSIIAAYAIALKALEPSTQLRPVPIQGSGGRTLDNSAIITTLEWRPGGKRRVRKPIGIITERGIRPLEVSK